MKTIEMTVTVDEGRQLTLQLPDGIVPGRHKVVLVIDDITESPLGADDVDAAFAEMVNDSEYQTKAMQLDAEFAVAQWEALQVAEAGQ
jgi:hypothetical protein